MRKWLKRVLIVLGVFAGILVLDIAVFAVIYSPEYVFRVLRFGSSDVNDYLVNFPGRPMAAPAEAFHFDNGADETRVAGLFEPIFNTGDLDSFLTDTGTQALIVIQDDRVLYEKYFNGTRRDTMATSFSVAKSFTTALVGIAVEEGAIGSIEDPITTYLPELAERDPRFSDITIRHVMMMAAGLDFEKMRPGIFNGDDSLTTYYPNQREAALEFTQIAGPPGEYFLYNKYYPQILGMILERATGTPVADYLEAKIWSRIGMEFDGSWSLDSEWNGFEKMETGVNARPIDYAKFGRLYLEDGNWFGEQVIPAAWVHDSTQVEPAVQYPEYYSNSFGTEIYKNGGGYYKYMWYGIFRDGGDYDFYGEGDRGQFIYVSPQKNLIIIRNGFEFGIPGFDWVNGFYQFATQIDP